MPPLNFLMPGFKPKLDCPAVSTNIPPEEWDEHPDHFYDFDSDEWVSEGAHRAHLQAKEKKKEGGVVVDMSTFRGAVKKNRKNAREGKGNGDGTENLADPSIRENNLQRYSEKNTVRGNRRDLADGGDLDRFPSAEPQEPRHGWNSGMTKQEWFDSYHPGRVVPRRPERAFHPLKHVGSLLSTVSSRPGASVNDVYSTDKSTDDETKNENGWGTSPGNKMPFHGLKLAAVTHTNMHAHEGNAVVDGNHNRRAASLLSLSTHISNDQLRSVGNSLSHYRRKANELVYHTFEFINALTSPSSSSSTFDPRSGSALNRRLVEADGEGLGERLQSYIPPPSSVHETRFSQNKEMNSLGVPATFFSHKEFPTKRKNGDKFFDRRTREDFVFQQNKDLEVRNMYVKDCEKIDRGYYDWLGPWYDPDTGDECDFTYVTYHDPVSGKQLTPETCQIPPDPTPEELEAWRQKKIEDAIKIAESIAAGGTGNPLSAEEAPVKLANIEVVEMTRSRHNGTIGGKGFVALEFQLPRGMEFYGNFPPMHFQLTTKDEKLAEVVSEPIYHPKGSGQRFTAYGGGTVVNEELLLNRSRDWDDMDIQSLYLGLRGDLGNNLLSDMAWAMSVNLTLPGFGEEYDGAASYRIPLESVAAHGGTVVEGEIEYYEEPDSEVEVNGTIDAPATLEIIEASEDELIINMNLTFLLNIEFDITIPPFDIDVFYTDNSENVFEAAHLDFKGIALRPAYQKIVTFPLMSVDIWKHHGEGLGSLLERIIGFDRFQLDIKGTSTENLPESGASAIMDIHFETDVEQIILNAPVGGYEEDSEYIPPPPPESDDENAPEYVTPPPRQPTEEEVVADTPFTMNRVELIEIVKSNELVNITMFLNFTLDLPIELYGDIPSIELLAGSSLTENVILSASTQAMTIPEPVLFLEFVNMVSVAILDQEGLLSVMGSIEEGVYIIFTGVRDHPSVLTHVLSYTDIDINAQIESSGDAPAPVPTRRRMSDSGEDVTGEDDTFSGIIEITSSPEILQIDVIVNLTLPIDFDIVVPGMEMTLHQTSDNKHYDNMGTIELAPIQLNEAPEENLKILSVQIRPDEAVVFGDFLTRFINLESVIGAIRSKDVDDPEREPIYINTTISVQGFNEFFDGVTMAEGAVSGKTVEEVNEASGPSISIDSNEVNFLRVAVLKVFRNEFIAEFAAAAWVQWEDLPIALKGNLPDICMEVVDMKEDQNLLSIGVESMEFPEVTKSLEVFAWVESENQEAVTDLLHNLNHGVEVHIRGAPPGHSYHGNTEPPEAMHVLPLFLSHLHFDLDTLNEDISSDYTEGAYIPNGEEEEAPPEPTTPDDQDSSDDADDEAFRYNVYVKSTDEYLRITANVTLHEPIEIGFYFPAIDLMTDVSIAKDDAGEQIWRPSSALYLVTMDNPFRADKSGFDVGKYEILDSDAEHIGDFVENLLHDEIVSMQMNGRSELPCHPELDYPLEINITFTDFTKDDMLYIIPEPAEMQTSGPAYVVPPSIVPPLIPNEDIFPVPDMGKMENGEEDQSNTEEANDDYEYSAEYQDLSYEDELIAFGRASLKTFHRDDDLIHLEAILTLKWNLPLYISGDMPSIAVESSNTHTGDKVFAFLIPGAIFDTQRTEFSLSSDVKLWEQQWWLDGARGYEDLALTVTGSAGHGIISTIMSRVHYDVELDKVDCTSGQARPATGAMEVDENGVPMQTVHTDLTEDSTYALGINFVDNAEHFITRVRLGLYETGFEIHIPEMSILFEEETLGELMSLDFSGNIIPSITFNNIHLMDVKILHEQAGNLGTFIAQIIDHTDGDMVQTLTLKAEGPYDEAIQSEPHFDVSLTFSLDEVIELMDSFSEFRECPEDASPSAGGMHSSSPSPSPEIGALEDDDGFQPLSANITEDPTVELKTLRFIRLERNADMFQASVGLDVEWGMPVHVQGHMSALAVEVIDKNKEDKVLIESYVHPFTFIAGEDLEVNVDVTSREQQSIVNTTVDLMYELGAKVAVRGIDYGTTLQKVLSEIEVEIEIEPAETIDSVETVVEDISDDPTQRADDSSSDKTEVDTTEEPVDVDYAVKISSSDAFLAAEVSLFLSKEMALPFDIHVPEFVIDFNSWEALDSEGYPSTFVEPSFMSMATLHINEMLLKKEHDNHIDVGKFSIMYEQADTLGEFLADVFHEDYETHVIAEMKGQALSTDEVYDSEDRDIEDSYIHLSVDTTIQGAIDFVESMERQVEEKEAAYSAPAEVVVYHSPSAAGQYTLVNPQWKLPQKGSGIVYFEGKATSDLYLGLFSVADTREPPAEGQPSAEHISLIYGGWDNGWCAMQFFFQTDESNNQHYGACSLKPADGWGHYWLKVDQQEISIGWGKYAGKNSFLTFAPSDASRQTMLDRMQYFTISSWQTDVFVRNVVIEEVGTPEYDIRLGGIGIDTIQYIERRYGGDGYLHLSPVVQLDFDWNLPITGTLPATAVNLLTDERGVYEFDYADEYDYPAYKKDGLGIIATAYVGTLDLVQGNRTIAVPANIEVPRLEFLMDSFLYEDLAVEGMKLYVSGNRRRGVGGVLSRALSHAEIPIEIVAPEGANTEEEKDQAFDSDTIANPTDGASQSAEEEEVGVAQEDVQFSLMIESDFDMWGVTLELEFSPEMIPGTIDFNTILPATDIKLSTIDRLTNKESILGLIDIRDIKIGPEYDNSLAPVEVAFSREASTNLGVYMRETVENVLDEGGVQHFRAAGTSDERSMLSGKKFHFAVEADLDVKRSMQILADAVSYGQPGPNDVPDGDDTLSRKTASRGSKLQSADDDDVLGEDAAAEEERELDNIIKNVEIRNITRTAELMLVKAGASVDTEGANFLYGHTPHMYMGLSVDELDSNGNPIGNKRKLVSVEVPALDLLKWDGSETSRPFDVWVEAILYDQQFALDMYYGTAEYGFRVYVDTTAMGSDAFDLFIAAFRYEYDLNTPEDGAGTGTQSFHRNGEGVFSGRDNRRRHTQAEDPMVEDYSIVIKMFESADEFSVEMTADLSLNESPISFYLAPSTLEFMGQASYYPKSSFMQLEMPGMQVGKDATAHLNFGKFYFTMEQAHAMGLFLDEMLYSEDVSIAMHADFQTFGGEKGVIHIEANDFDMFDIYDVENRGLQFRRRLMENLRDNVDAHANVHLDDEIKANAFDGSDKHTTHTQGDSKGRRNKPTRRSHLQADGTVEEEETAFEISLIELKSFMRSDDLLKLDVGISFQWSLNIEFQGFFPTLDCAIKDPAKNDVPTYLHIKIPKIDFDAMPDKSALDLVVSVEMDKQEQMDFKGVVSDFMIRSEPFSIQITGDAPDYFECFTEDNGSDYIGHQFFAQGMECQRWDEQFPHQHPYNPATFPEKNMIVNYCRNPDDDPRGAWCIPKNAPQLMKMYCNIGVPAASCVPDNPFMTLFSYLHYEIADIGAETTESSSSDNSNSDSEYEPESESGSDSSSETQPTTPNYPPSYYSYSSSSSSSSPTGSSDSSDSTSSDSYIYYYGDDDDSGGGGGGGGNDPPPIGGRPEHLHSVHNKERRESNGVRMAKSLMRRMGLATSFDELREKQEKRREKALFEYQQARKASLQSNGGRSSDDPGHQHAHTQSDGDSALLGEDLSGPWDYGIIPPADDVVISLQGMSPDFITAAVDVKFEMEEPLPFRVYIPPLSFQAHSGDRTNTSVKDYMLSIEIPEFDITPEQLAYEYRAVDMTILQENADKLGEFLRRVVENEEATVILSARSSKSDEVEVDIRIGFTLDDIMNELNSTDVEEAVPADGSDSSGGGSMPNSGDEEADENARFPSEQVMVHSVELTEMRFLDAAEESLLIAAVADLYWDIPILFDVDIDRLTIDVKYQEEGLPEMSQVVQLSIDPIHIALNQTYLQQRASVTIVSKSLIFSLATTEEEFALEIQGVAGANPLTTVLSYVPFTAEIGAKENKEAAQEVVKDVIVGVTDEKKSVEVFLDTNMDVNGDRLAVSVGLAFNDDDPPPLDIIIPAVTFQLKYDALTDSDHPAGHLTIPERVVVGPRGSKTLHNFAVGTLLNSEGGNLGKIINEFLLTLGDVDFEQLGPHVTADIQGDSPLLDCYIGGHAHMESFNDLLIKYEEEVNQGIADTYIYDDGIQNINCETTADSFVVNRNTDVGKLIKVRCPSQCSEVETANVFGCHEKSDYTHDSSICRAAIHEGLIGDCGGEFFIRTHELENQEEGCNICSSLWNGIYTKFQVCDDFFFTLEEAPAVNMVPVVDMTAIELLAISKNQYDTYEYGFARLGIKGAMDLKPLVFRGDIVDGIVVMGVDASDDKNLFNVTLDQLVFGANNTMQLFTELYIWDEADTVTRMIDESFELAIRGDPSHNSALSRMIAEIDYRIKFVEEEEAPETAATKDDTDEAGNTIPDTAAFEPGGGSEDHGGSESYYIYSGESSSSSPSSSSSSSSSSDSDSYYYPSSFPGGDGSNPNEPETFDDTYLPTLNIDLDSAQTFASLAIDTIIPAMSEIFVPIRIPEFSIEMRIKNQDLRPPEGSLTYEPYFTVNLNQPIEYSSNECVVLDFSIDFEIDPEDGDPPKDSVEWYADVMDKYLKGETDLSFIGFTWLQSKHFPEYSQSGQYIYIVNLDAPSPNVTDLIRRNLYADECYTQSNGADYTGDVRFTEKGYLCQRWDTQYPHDHTYTPENYPDDDLRVRACRNPGGSRERPWCFTTSLAIGWDYCDVGPVWTDTCTDDAAARRRLYGESDYDEYEEPPPPDNAPINDGAVEEEGVGINSIHIIGSGEDGNMIKIPCIYPGMVCPYEASEAESTPIVLAVNLSMAALPLPIHLEVAELEFEVDCCIHNRVAMVHVDRVMLSDESHAWIEATLELDNLLVLQDMLDGLLNQFDDKQISVSGRSDTNLLSALFSKFEFEYLVLTMTDDPEEPDYDPDAAASEHSHSHPTIIPMSSTDSESPPASDNAGADGDEPDKAGLVDPCLIPGSCGTGGGGGGWSDSDTYSYIDHGFDVPDSAGGFNYKLSRTDSNSATFEFAVGFVNPINFDLSFGDVTISIQHDTYEIANVFVSDLHLPPEQLIVLAPTFRLHGQDPLDERCWDRVELENRAFCVANDAIASIAAGENVEGTEITVVISGTNHFDEAMSIQLVAAIMPVDPDADKSKTTPRSDDTPAAPSDDDDSSATGGSTEIIDQIIEGYDLQISDNLQNIFYSVFADELTVNFGLTLGNPFLIGLKLAQFKVTIAIKDTDGIQDLWYIPDSPQQPAEFAYLLDGFVYNFEPTLTIEPESSGYKYYFEIDFPWDTITSAIARIYDEVVVKERLCMHIIDADVELQLQAPGYQPLTFHQIISRYNIPVLGGDIACEGGVECVPLLDNVLASPIDSSGYDFNGGAQYYGGGIRLTELCYTCTKDAKASTVIKEKVFLQDSWMVQFDVEFDGVSGVYDPSEGFGFFVMDGDTGQVGSDYGYKGIDNSFGWIFDTDRHFGQLWQNGQPTDFKRESDDIPGIGDFQQKKYRMKIYYFHHLQRTYIYIDGVLLMIAKMDTNDLLLEDGMGHLGFSAQGATLKKGSWKIHQWWFYTFKSRASKTRMREDGRIIGKVYQTVSVTFDMYDACGYPRHRGGEELLVWFKSERSGLNTGAIAYHDHLDGSYTMDVQLIRWGAYEVWHQLHDSVQIVGTIYMEEDW